MADTKYCKRCDSHKPLDDFGFKIKGRNERQSWCRACRRDNNRDRYSQNILGCADTSRARCTENGRRLKQEVIDAYGGECSCCGESELCFLTIDHIYGDGAADRKRITGSSSRGGSPFYCYLKRNGFPKDRYQALCYNCNCAKRLNQVCPHKLKHIPPPEQLWLFTPEELTQPHLPSF